MSADAVARARACVGARFRPQGRLAVHGLDCVGVAMIAWDVPAEEAPRSYRLRGVSLDQVERDLSAALTAVPVATAGAGDVLLVEAGAGRPHLLVLCPEGFVHADAAAGRVIEVPGAVPWPARSAWRKVN